MELSLSKSEIYGSNVATLGKSLTHVPLSPSSITGKKMVMLWEWTCNGRLDRNRSAGLISSRFSGDSERHFDENSIESEVFETVNFNLNEEVRGDRPHPTPITVPSKHH